VSGVCDSRDDLLVRQLGDAGFQSAFNSVTGQLRRAVVQPLGEEDQGFLNPNLSKLPEVVSVHRDSQDDAG
jgi:hypothetical protein